MTFSWCFFLWRGCAGIRNVNRLPKNTQLTAWISRSPLSLIWHPIPGKKRYTQRESINPTGIYFISPGNISICECDSINRLQLVSVLSFISHLTESQSSPYMIWKFTDHFRSVPFELRVYCLFYYWTVCAG